MRRDDRGADDHARAAPRVNPHESVGRAIGDRAVHGRQWLRVRIDVDPALAGLALRQPDVRDLGIGIGAPRHRQFAQAAPTERAHGEQRVLDDDPRRGIGGVRKLPRQADVAAGVDARVRRSQEVVDANDRRWRSSATPAASRFSPSTLGVRPVLTSTASTSATPAPPCASYAIARTPSRTSTRPMRAPSTSRTPSRCSACSTTAPTHRDPRVRAAAADRERGRPRSRDARTPAPTRSRSARRR